MALEKDVKRKIEILPDGTIQIRDATVILEDGIQFGSPTYHRHVLAPGDSLENEDDRTKAIAAAVWTKDVLDAFEEQKK